MAIFSLKEDLSIKFNHPQAGLIRPSQIAKLLWFCHNKGQKLGRVNPASWYVHTAVFDVELDAVSALFFRAEIFGTVKQPCESASKKQSC